MLLDLLAFVPSVLGHEILLKRLIACLIGV